MRNNTLNLTALLCGLVILGSAGAATEKELLAKAVKASQSIGPDMEVKQKLRSYETIIDSYETIIADHAGTDIGLELLTSGTYKDFNFEALRGSYLQELTDYFEIVCSTSPSVRCLAFVAMNDAYKSCKTQNSSMPNASGNLFNTIRVFNSTKKDEKYAKVATGIYRDCFVDVSNDSYTRDHHRMKLASVLLESGEEGKAKGLIQAMTTPFFKFQGALEVLIAKSNELTKEQYKRMIKYIGTLDSSQIGLANIYLMAVRFESGPKPILKSEVNRLEIKNVGDIEDCNMRLNAAFNLLAEFSVAGLQHGLNKENLLSNIPRAMKKSSFRCKSKPYPMALELMNAAALRGDFDLAEKIKFYTNNSKPTRLELFNFYIAQLDYRVEILDNFLLVVDGSKENFDQFVSRYQLPPEALLEQYRILLTEKRVCDAIGLLFGSLRKTTVYQDAVSDFIGNAEFNDPRKYSCGDEDLELLLN